MTLQYTFTDLKNLFPSVRLKKAKERIRERVLQKRRILTKEEVLRRSEQIRVQLTSLPEFAAAQNIMIYYPIHNEATLKELTTLYPDKQFYLPVVHRASIEVRAYNANQPLHRGKFGIPQPDGKAYNGSIDMIVIPGVAFDTHKNRLGRGGGYYDRFLKQRHKALLVGVGYDFQLLNDILPHTFRDKNMDIIVTETQIIR